MFILGLTGSIGMGKTTAGRMFGRLGVPVHDADAAVHRALAPGGAAAARVAQAFPEALVDGAIDRRRLGDAVFGAAERLAALEAILHPIAAAGAEAFLGAQARARAALAVLDIPLLFETGGEARVDAVLLVTAPEFLQRQRVLARPGMSLTKFDRICANQLPDRDKRARADFIITTGLGKAHSFAAIEQLTGLLRRAKGSAWHAGRPTAR